MIYCPGCRENHFLPTVSVDGPVWKFNGDRERPTFTPSLLVSSGCKTPQHKPGDDCWCTYNAEQAAKGEPLAPFRCERCHLILTDGKLQFLSDCSHHLAGQTMDLPDLPEPEKR